MGSRKTDTIMAVAQLNKQARRARRYCTDVIRQTSMQRYYGRYGGAALYAPEDESEAQKRRIDEAVRLLTRVTCLLRDAAIAGGITEAKVREAIEEERRQYSDDARPRPVIYRLPEHDKDRHHEHSTI